MVVIFMIDGCYLFMMHNTKNTQYKDLLPELQSNYIMIECYIEHLKCFNAGTISYDDDEFEIIIIIWGGDNDAKNDSQYMHNNIFCQIKVQRYKCQKTIYYIILYMLCK